MKAKDKVVRVSAVDMGIKIREGILAGLRGPKSTHIFTREEELQLSAYLAVEVVRYLSRRPRGGAKR